MMRSGFRFHPPRVDACPVRTRVLRAAFSEDLVADSGHSILAAEHYAIARELGLQARLSRLLVDRAFLLDRRLEGELRTYRRYVAARSIALSELIEQLSVLAERRQSPAILLKGMALIEAEVVEVSSRETADLDVLLDEEGAEVLAQDLRIRGFSSAILGEAHHHPPLVHPRLGTVELHTKIPGISTPSSETLNARWLRDAALCRLHPKLPFILIPATVFLAAHALVHGMHQHGLVPLSYPFLRPFADLIDLAEDEKGGVAGLISSVPAHLLWSLSEREVRAAVVLCQRLLKGRDLLASDDAGALLRHAIAGATSPTYRRRLRLQAVIRALCQGEFRRFALRLRQRSVLRRLASGAPPSGSHGDSA